MSKYELLHAQHVLSTAKFGVNVTMNRKHMKTMDVSGGGFFSDLNIGEQLADTIATGVKKGFIAGPFKASPLLNAIP